MWKAYDVSHAIDRRFYNTEQLAKPQSGHRLRSPWPLRLVVVLAIRPPHHRASRVTNSNRKFRRHINENALGIIRSTLNSGGFGPQAPNMNKELGIPSNAGPMNQLAAGYQRPLSHPGGSSGVAAAAAAVTAAQQEKGMYSISQLNLEITEQHVGSNGRMEITCLSTIPATVGQGEQYADYKTFSVKVEVERHQVSSTSTAPPSIGMAALGNGNGHGNETSAGWRARGVVLTHLWSLAPLFALVLLSLSY
ncbi:hypothetical protein ACLKA7_009311 [Drosophila subpalustris]